MFDPLKSRGENYTWINELWEDSVFVTFINELKTFYKQFFIKLLKWIERTLMFLTTGHIRTFSEITEFCVKNGFGKGMAKYIGVLYFMKFIALPLVWGTFKAGKNFWNNIYDKDNGFWAEDTEELLKRAYGKAFEPWTKLLGGDVTQLVPWNWLWDDLLNKTDEAARQEIKSRFESKLNQLQEQGKITKKQADELTAVFMLNGTITLEDIRNVLKNNGTPSTTGTTDTTVVDKDIKKFKDFIKTSWGPEYNDTDKFTKEGDIYVVDVKGLGRFKYQYNGTTFIKTTTN
jgi:hypothetical protein